jgi:hypothetical protein
VISEEPVEIPLTTPEPVPIVATDGVPLLHTPPEVVSDRVVVEPAHSIVIPVMGVGGTYMLSVLFTKQPLGNV